MTEQYPIIQQRSLDPTRKRGPLGMGKRQREENELPKPQAHEVLVYRVNGQYIVDTGRLGVRHEEVVQASHVSVVNMSRDTEVMVRLKISSAEASEFTLQITFVCTVTDPVTVVREGLGDAEATLRGYLRSHHRIFELGLDRKLAEINEVRRDVRAQVMAYAKIKPPIVPGMVTEMASVEVLTPDEMIDFEKKRRNQQYTHQLEYDRESGGQTLEQFRQRHQQDLEYQRQRHDQVLTTERQRHELLLTGERRDFEADGLLRAAELIGDDPRQALRLAYVAGQLDAGSLAERMRSDLDHEQSNQDARVRAEREDKLRERELDRDHDFRAKLLERKETLRVEEATRLDRQRMVETNLAILKEFADRGHLDLVNVNLDRLVDELLGTARPELEPPSTPELPPAEQDNEVREEDAD